MSNHTLLAPPDAEAAKSGFLEIFRSVWHEYRTRVPSKALHSLFGCDAEWTRCMLGYLEAEAGLPVLHDVVARYARWRGYSEDVPDRIVAQELKFDLTLAGGVKGFPPSRTRFGYPQRFEVLLEHENDWTSIHEEVWKLLMVRSDLAVLVSYLPSGKRETRFLDQAIEMIRMAATADPAARADRLLFVIGHREAEGAPINWFVFDFNSAGSPARYSVPLDAIAPTPTVC